MIPPYQAADEETRRQAGAPIKTAATLATSAIAGGAALKKVLPFLNNLIPGELMRKGLSKVNPDIGKFVDTALNNGYGLDEIRNFMSEKFNKRNSEDKEKKSSQSSNNPIQDFETNYPDISKALSGYINQGQTPEAAAGILKNSTPFVKKVNQLEKDVGKNFIDYVLELFGSNGPQSQSQPNQEMFQSPQIQKQQSQQASPQGNNDNALLAALDKILKM
jgi:hypothetical protein